MRKTNILLRRLEANKVIASLQKRVSMVEKNWDEVKAGCNHEITISTWEMEPPFGMLISKIPQRTFCLLCNEHLSPRMYLADDFVDKLKKSVKIDLQEYPNICNKWGVRHYSEKLIELYKDIYIEFDDLTEYEIGRIMKRRLDAIDVFL